MLNQDLSRFAILMTGTGELYDKPITQAFIEAYWNIFKDYTFKDVDKAFHLHHRNPDVGKYFPIASDIIMAIEDFQNRTLRAWSKVISAVQSVGVYSSVAFDDPLIHAVISDMGGWQKLGSVDSKQLPFVAKEFQDQYKGYLVNKPIHHPKYFAGRIESRNSNSCGYVHDPPRLIGDKEKAKQVIATGSSASILISDLKYKPIFLENKQSKCKSSGVLKSVLKNAPRVEQKTEKMKKIEGKV